MSLDDQDQDPAIRRLQVKIQMDIIILLFVFLLAFSCNIKR